MKLLIGGSPCTHWSIAQTKNRETEASGIGWELFLNYRIARDKYQPDYFLYENNKSMSPAIRAQITAELGVEPVLINSALVSAQNRQRLYELVDDGNNFFRNKEEYERTFQTWTTLANNALSRLRGVMDSDKRRWNGYMRDRKAKTP